MLSLISDLLKGKTILHMGCHDCGNEESYLGVKVLNKVGLEPDINQFTCGCDYYGTDESKILSLVEQNKPLLKKYKTVIVGCARCFHLMRTYYEYIDVQHISHVLYEHLRDADPAQFVGSGDVYYHDPCYLTRFQHITENPRRVLEILGYNVKEFKNNRKKTDCCGGYSPIRVLRERASDMRLQQIPKKAAVTSACPKCTQNFHNFNKTNDKSIKHFLDLVDHALNIEIAAVY
jgi:Fe-S oxidoreductase